MAQNKNDNSGNRGFAGMDPDQQREIASMGGKAAHQSGNAHEFDSEEARKAGQKGGKAAHQNRDGSGSRSSDNDSGDTNSRSDSDRSDNASSM